MRLMIAIIIIFLKYISITHAADISNDRISTNWRLFDEIRGGLFSLKSKREEDGALALNGELLSARISSNVDNVFLHFLLTPRLHIGTNINISSETSWAYTGLTWTLDLTDWFFVEGTFGGGIHDGKLEPPVQGNKSLLGTRILFRESVSIGFRMNDQLSFMLTAEHLSNADISKYNNGINAIGGRIGYVF